MLLYEPYIICFMFYKFHLNSGLRIAHSGLDLILQPSVACYCPFWYNPYLLLFGVVLLSIIYPENCSIQIALVKTFNRFPYCTESRKVLSY